MPNFGKHSLSRNMSENDAITVTYFQDIFLIWNRKVYHYSLSKTGSTFNCRRDRTTQIYQNLE